MARKGNGIYKRKDGRWEGRYIKSIDSDTGKKRMGYVYGTSYQECRHKLREADSHPERRAPMKGGPTFGAWMEFWLQSRSSELRASTYITYKNQIQWHILPKLGDIKLNRLSQKRLDAFLEEKRTGGRVDGQGGLSLSTVRLLATIITSALIAAKREGLVDETVRLTIQPEKGAAKVTPVYARTEQAKLERSIMALAEGEHMYYALLLSLRTGLRVGELSALRFQHINLRESLLTFNSTLQRMRNPEGSDSKTSLVVGPPKSSASNRVIPLQEEALEILRKCWAAQTSNPTEEESYVFGRGSRPAEPRELERCYARAVAAAGVPHLKFHALRHTFATRCMEAGMDDKSLSEILGHSSTAITTNIYVHSLMEQKRKGMDRLSQYLAPGVHNAEAADRPDWNLIPEYVWGGLCVPAGAMSLAEQLK